MINFSPPLAFVNHPLMLGWLVAAAAPLVIHLLSRRKYREVPWAAMQYLLAAVRKNARRIRIEQWILLAVRTLLIVLIVLAVAEPFLEQAGIQIGTATRTHKVLVVDGSFSMGYQATDKTRFERAVALAEQIVEESTQGDGFSLVVLGTPPRVVVGTPAFDRRVILAELEALKMPHGGGDLPATLAAVEQILQQARRDHPRLGHEEVFFLTDLGRTTWAPDLKSGSTAAEFRDRSLRLGRSSALYVIDLGQSTSENVAVTALKTLDPFAIAGRQASFEAEIRDFGHQPRPRQLVELWVDGRRVGEQNVDLEPGETATVVFPYRFDTAGDASVEVRAAGDRLDVDNHRWLAVPVKERLRVLCINGKPAGGRFEGATDYLVQALAPKPGDRGVIEPQVALESAILELDLAPFDCIFFANVGQFTGSEANVLSQYLQHGGGLVFFLGDQVQADSYNRRLTNRSAEGVDVLPATIGPLMPEGNYAFDPLDYRHPILSPFRGQVQGGLLTTPVQRYYRLEVDPESPARVALGFTDGNPAIVEESIGRGRSILVATSADVSWTAMPMWPSFLPIVRELLALAVRNQSADRNVEVGQPLAGAVRGVATSTPLALSLPGGEQTSLRLTSGGDYSEWSYPDTTVSGPYSAVLEGSTIGGELFAVNVDTTESDLTKLEPAELRDQVWAGVPFIHRTDWQNPDDEPTEPIVRRSSFHQLLLVGVLGLLFVETFLATWFGRRAA